MSIIKKGLTPFFYIDINKIKENYTELLDSIERTTQKAIIAYSIKANYHPDIIQLLYSLNSYFEVCSKYEYSFLISQGVEPQRIIVNACSATNDVFTWGDKSLIIIDDLQQLKYWVESHNQCEIGIRVNLDHCTTDERFRNKSSRFGINIKEPVFIDLLKKADTSKIVCLHCHLSGNNRSPSIYTDVLVELIRIADKLSLTKIKYIDLGGGFRIDSQYYSYNDYVNAIGQVYESFGINFRIIYELGNALVRNSTEYYTKIISYKNIEGKKIMIADGTSLQLPRANFVKTGYHFIHDNSLKESFFIRQIFGNTCKESDMIIELEKDEQISIGDILVIENVGAYSINEINTLILGMPNIFTSDEHHFE